MKSAAWGLYGLGVLIALLAIFSGDLDLALKSAIAAIVFFVGALLVALLRIADRLETGPTRTIEADVTTESL